MLTHIKKTIEELKVKIKSNVELINQNQAEIKHMMQRSNAVEINYQYESYNTQNKDLLSQNNDLINVELTLINFVEKYKNTAILKSDIPILDVYSITDQQEIFELTIKGIVPFNGIHPFYSSSEFIDKLIRYYETAENYEQCEVLKHLKEKIFG
jgi:hypothetical protein